MRKNDHDFKHLKEILIFDKHDRERIAKSLNSGGLKLSNYEHDLLQKSSIEKLLDKVQEKFQKQFFLLGNFYFKKEKGKF